MDAGWRGRFRGSRGRAAPRTRADGVGVRGQQRRIHVRRDDHDRESAGVRGRLQAERLRVEHRRERRAHAAGRGRDAGRHPPRPLSRRAAEGVAGVRPRERTRRRGVADAHARAGVVQAYRRLRLRPRGRRRQRVPAASRTFDRRPRRRPRAPSSRRPSSVTRLPRRPLGRRERRLHVRAGASPTTSPASSR